MCDGLIRPSGCNKDTWTETVFNAWVAKKIDARYMRSMVSHSWRMCVALDAARMARTRSAIDVICLGLFGCVKCLEAGVWDCDVQRGPVCSLIRPLGCTCTYKVLDSPLGPGGCGILDWLSTGWWCLDYGFVWCRFLKGWWVGRYQAVMV